MMLDLYTNSICLESYGRSSYARVLIKINACNDFSDILVMVVPNLEGNGYMKETVHIKYEWKPPRCSTCLIYGHSFVECPKAAPKWVVNSMDKGKWQTSKADDEGFIEVKKKRSGGNNGGTKNFKLVLVKPKIQYRFKAKQSTKGMSNFSKTTPFVSSNKASTSGYNKELPNNKAFTNSLETRTSSEGANDASLYEDKDYDIYDTYDIEGLTKQDLEFCDMMDINLCGRSRR
ncbi:hypothetical protein Tco_1220409 [Tanacetum coccineum]